MIIRNKAKDEPIPTIEVGDVLYGSETYCYLITKSLDEEHPFGLLNLYDPTDYDEYVDTTHFEFMVSSHKCQHYKGNQVKVEVGTNE